MSTCKKCHVALNDETILCPMCGRVNADANPKSADAQAQLADAFFSGEKGLRSDIAKARYWAERSSEQGNPDGTLVLWRCLLEDLADLGADATFDMLDDDLVASITQRLISVAEHCEERPPKLYPISVLFTAAGSATFQMDPGKSFVFFQKAAEAGDPLAMFDLGGFYLDGDGVEKNNELALHWLRKAADAGSADAAERLGDLLTDDPSSPDFQEGIRFLKKASDAGNINAKGLLGLVYRHGEGVKKDLIRAINLMSDAAAAGNPAIQYYLGVLLWNGEDKVKPNLPVARKWMAMAAEKDFKDSKELLAKIDDAIALEELGITQEELDRPNEPPPPAEEPAGPLSEADALRREVESLRAEVKRQNDRAEKFRSQLLAFTNRAEAERKEKLASLSQTKGDLFKAARSGASDPTAYVNLAKYFESAFGADIAFTARAWKSLEECTSDLNLVWTALYNLATVLHKLLKALPQAEAYERFRAKAGLGLDIARGNGKMTHANNALMANYRDTYNGKEIDVEAHVEKGGDPKSPKFLRVYFGYDPSVADKIVVSHVGSHLPNFQTLTHVGGW